MIGPGPMVIVRADDASTPGWSFSKYVVFEIAKAAAVAVATEGARWFFEEVRAAYRKGRPTT